MPEFHAIGHGDHESDEVVRFDDEGGIDLKTLGIGIPAQ
jgi:hypothetical protein